MKRIHYALSCVLILCLSALPCPAQVTAPAYYSVVPLSNYGINWDYSRNVPVLTGTSGGFPRSFSLYGSTFLTCIDGSGFDHATYRTVDNAPQVPVYVVLGIPEVNLSDGRLLTFRYVSGSETYFRVTRHLGNYIEMTEYDPR